MSQNGRVQLLKKNQTQRPEQRLDIYTKIRHTNGIPNIPMEPKFMQLPFMKLSRFADYKTTQLEKNYRYELTAERDLDINVDLVDNKRYAAATDLLQDRATPENMDPEDRYLIEEDAKPTDKRRANHGETVSWMRKIQYLGVENARFGVGADRQETKIGYKMFKSGETDQMYKDRQTQINAINKTFDDAKLKCTQHPTKKGVHAIEELPLLPDFEYWKLPFSQVLFDSDPIPNRSKDKDKDKIMERAIIQGLTDAQGVSFVAYYAPTEEALEKVVNSEKTGEPLDDDERLEYKLGREYNWAIRNEAMKGFEPNYFFSYRNGTAYYNILDTRVKLTRRPKSGIAETMLVKNDELNDADRNEFDKRITGLSEREIITEEEEEVVVAGDEENDDEKRREEERRATKAKTTEIFGSDQGSSSSSSEEEEDSSSESSSSSEASSAEDEN